MKLQDKYPICELQTQIVVMLIHYPCYINTCVYIHVHVCVIYIYSKLQSNQWFYIKPAIYHSNTNYKSHLIQTQDKMLGEVTQLQ